jgi:hypothetical protein
MTAANSVQEAALEFPDGSFDFLTETADPLILQYIDYYDNPVLLDLSYPPGPYRLDVATLNDGIQSVILD